MVSIIEDIAVGRAFEKTSDLNKLTYIAPSVVIPRRTRRFTLWGLLPKELEQRERGLFALKDIRANSLIGHFEGEVVDFERLTKMDETTTYVKWNKGLKKGVLGRNFLRFANHQPAEKANMLPDDFSFYATRDIAANEELTWAYFPGEWGREEKLRL